jgi:hypothetical protein
LNGVEARLFRLGSLFLAIGPGHAPRSTRRYIKNQPLVGGKGVAAPPDLLERLDVAGIAQCRPVWIDVAWRQAFFGSQYDNGIGVRERK